MSGIARRPGLPRLRSREDRGTATIEMLFIVPALLVILNLVITCGRVVIVHSAVREAAQSAARSGSLARDPDTAYGNALTANSAVIIRNGLHCESGRSFADDASAFLNQPGSSASVGAGSFYATTVTCKIPLLKLPGFGSAGSVTVSYSALSPVDPYRCHEITC